MTAGAQINRLPFGKWCCELAHAEYIDLLMYVQDKSLCLQVAGASGLDEWL